MLVHVGPIAQRTMIKNFHSKCENDGVQYLQEATYSPFCIARAQASYHCKGAREGEIEVFSSLCLGRRVGSERLSKVMAKIKQVVDQ